MSIKKTYIPAKPRSSKLVGASMSGGVAGSVSSSSADQNAHSHSNKVVLDKLTDGDIDVLGKLSLDEGGNIKVDTTLWATGGISALGLGEGGGGSGGGGVDMLDSWANYTEVKADFYAPASLLVPFRNDTLSRLASLEAGGGGGGDIEIVVTGAGNAVTGVSLSGNTLTFAKSSTFALSTQLHTHANKPILDQITQSNIDVLAKLSIVDGNIKVDTTLWATGGISALGLGEGGGGSGGGGVDMLDSWANYTAVKANYYVPASLLVPFRDDTLSRLTSLESGSATSITTTGSGNAITSLTKSGSVITATKGLTFALASHTHTIAQITGLQGALDLKASQSDIDTAIDNIEIGGRNLLLNTQSFTGNMWSNSDKWQIDGEYRGFTVIKRNADWFGIRQQVPVENGEYYTFSSFIKIDESKSKKLYLIIRNNGNNAGGGTVISSNLSDILGKERGVWHRAVVVVKATQDCNLSVDIEGYDDNTAYVYLAGFKLEKGNIATDWTPAPEDQVSDWDVTDVNSFAFLKNKPTQLSQFTDNIGVATHIANKANPHAVTKSQVGLGNVDNTSDLLKPISTATQNALNLKANLASPTFTGNVTAPTFIGALSGSADSANLLKSVNGNTITPVPTGTMSLNRLSAAFSGSMPASDNANAALTINTHPGDYCHQLGFSSNGRMYHRMFTNEALNDTKAWGSLAFLTDNVASATRLQTARTIAGVSFDGSANIDIPFANLESKPTTLAGYGITDAVTTNTTQTITGAKTFSTLLTASAGVNTPKVDLGNGFTIEPSGTELVFKYNGVIKQRMLSDGTILATRGITALSTE